MNGHILVLGKGGQLSTALVAKLDTRAHVADVTDVDFASNNFLSQLDEFTHGRIYDAVFNAAAYTQVDKAETEKELAFRINATSVGELASWCKARKLPLVHYSTAWYLPKVGD